MVGRADRSNPKLPLLAWSGASFSVAFTGTDASIHLTGLGGIYDVFVDGATAPTSVLDLTSDASELHPIATGLTSGPHTVTVFKRTEGQYSNAAFAGFDLKGTIATLPAAPIHKIEFIGNSITCGYGDLDSAGYATMAAGNGPVWNIETEDHYYSYTAVTARTLGAEHHTVCFSGKGMYRNNDNSTTNVISDYYGLIDPNATTPWDFTKWTPDVVSINLGTNDFYLGPPDSTSYVNATIAFIKKVYTYYPNVTVFIVDGPMLSDYYPSNVAPYNANIPNTAAYVLGTTIRSQTINARYLNAATAALNSQGYAKVFRDKLPASTGLYGYGGDWHPSKAEHAYLATLLSATIKAQMGW